MRKHFGIIVGLACLTMARAEQIAIINARIEASPGSVIEKGVILIDGERITDVGAALTAPTGWRVIDANGKTIYAGFIDGYSTRGLKLPDPPAAPSPRAVNTTAPATMWTENRKGIRAQIDASKHVDLATVMGDCHKAGFTAAFLNPGQGTIRGGGTFAMLTDDKPNPAPLGMELSFRGGTGAGYPSSLMGIVALMRQTFLDAIHQNQFPPEKPDADLTALAPLLTGRSVGVFHVDTEVDVVRALAMGEEFKFNVILKGGRDAHKRAAWLAERKVPLLADIAVGTEPKVEPTADGPPAGVLEERRDNWRIRATGPKKLHEAGVKFAFISDGDSLPRFLQNVREVVKQGLPREAALAALTTSPADILGRSTDLGTIAKGKLANIVIASGDIFAEGSRVESVIVAGKVFNYKESQS